MCGSGFVGDVVAKLFELTSHRLSTGEISLALPARIHNPPEHLVRNALGTLISFLRQEYHLAILDDFIGREIDSREVADILLSATVAVAPKFRLKAPRYSQIGEKRIYFLLLYAVFTIFCDALVGKQVAKDDLLKNFQSFQTYLDFLLRQAPSDTIN